MSFPDNIDHIVYAVADLQAGIDEIESLLGVRAAMGGRHPKFGTHNALLSLGPVTYLEIIAPDPGLPEPDEGFMFGISNNQKSRITTWALRTDSINELAEAAINAGVRIGSIATGSREAPDGTLLAWQLSDPYAMPSGGAVPFLIDWGRTPHPSGTTPPAGELTGFRLEHPEPDKVRQALSVLGVEIDIGKSDECALIATIKTDRGFVELR
jgi:hypothetical protein